MPNSKALARLLEQQERLRQQIKKLQKSNDTRTKILHGVALLKALEAGKVEQTYIDQLLDEYITQKSAREFLGLEPLIEAHDTEEVNEIVDDLLSNPDNDTDTDYEDDYQTDDNYQEQDNYY